MNCQCSNTLHFLCQDVVTRVQPAGAVLTELDLFVLLTAVLAIEQAQRVVSNFIADPVIDEKTVCATALSSMSCITIRVKGERNILATKNKMD